MTDYYEESDTEPEPTCINCGAYAGERHEPACGIGDYE